MCRLIPITNTLNIENMVWKMISSLNQKTQNFGNDGFITSSNFMIVNESIYI
jgi:hypothetical protein